MDSLRGIVERLINDCLVCCLGIYFDFFALVDAQNETMKKKLINLLTKEVCVFLLMAFFMGVGSGTIENFLFLYLDELGAPEVLMGLSLTVGYLLVMPGQMLNF